MSNFCDDPEYLVKIYGPLSIDGECALSMVIQRTEPSLNLLPTSVATASENRT